jgi:hypothetical protein
MFNDDYNICISYALYGTNFKKYYLPLLNNIKNTKYHILISTTESYKTVITNYFKNYLNKINIITYPDSLLSKAKLLRYESIRYFDFECYFFKDSDSIITSDEYEIMHDWYINKKYEALIIRNHPLHTAPILGGMFGIKKSLKYLIIKESELFLKQNSGKFALRYNYDQVWLRKCIYNNIKYISLIYTSHLHYIGESYIKINYDFNNHIGKAIYAVDVDKKYITKLVKVNKAIYGGNMISIPYINLMGKLYDRVLPVLLMAYIYNLRKKHLWYR